MTERSEAYFVERLIEIADAVLHPPKSIDRKSRKVVHDYSEARSQIDELRKGFEEVGEDLRQKYSPMLDEFESHLGERSQYGVAA